MRLDLPLSPLSRRHCRRFGRGGTSSASSRCSSEDRPDARRVPPNKILFVQNLPDDTTKEALEALFRPYALLFSLPILASTYT
jgi:hypothetical protein